MKGKHGGKGFTLAELLVVVAIIGVLVAIAIPVFGSAMDGAVLARDSANVRSIYGELIIGAMTNPVKVDISDYLDDGDYDSAADYTYYATSVPTGIDINSAMIGDVVVMQFGSEVLKEALGTFDCTLDYVVPLTASEIAEYESADPVIFANFFLHTITGRDIKVISPNGTETVISIDDGVSVYIDDILG